MQNSIKKLTIIGIQQTFLQMVHEQITALTQGKIKARTVSFNDLDEIPLSPDETILYFSKRLKSFVSKMYPECNQYLYAKRENLIYNMQALFALEKGQKILVVNDLKDNTDDMIEELKLLDLGHTYFPYYPEEPLPESIGYVVTAGERVLVPRQLQGKPIIDIGLRFISLETVYTIFDHFQIPYRYPQLARLYMSATMVLTVKWPVLGEDRYRRPSWFGIRQNFSAPVTFDSLIQKSHAMKSFCKSAKKIAETDNPIHIYGHIGTGKSKIAQAVHNASDFRHGPFVSINCGARLPETLELELFGREDNSITHKSLFETAENGTLCIEEIRKLPAKLQAGLLQAFTEKRIIRSNGSGVVPINCRLITTSSQRLDNAIDQGFNPELLLMITQYSCRVPTLKERMVEFNDLILDYLKNVIKKPHIVIPPDTMDILKAHSWEGNVQELYNVIQHVVCMSNDVLLKKNLPYYISQRNPSHKNSQTYLRTLTENQEKEFSAITQSITKHGFLEENNQILKIYLTGKDQNKSLARHQVQELLREKGFDLTQQQLRLKLEHMNTLGLLIVRPGRGGTTISETGEKYLLSQSVEHF